MKRTVNIYQGKEISPKEIEIIKRIAQKKYSPEIYQEYHEFLTDVESIATIYETDINNLFLILGEDWFLIYENEEDVGVLEWVALDDTDNKMKQIMEMLKTLKEILLQNKDKYFVVSMRHNTSYQFYQKMLKKGYFEEDYHELTIDIACPDQLANTFEEMGFLDDASMLENPNLKISKGDQAYIFHNIDFFVSDKFINKYEKKRT